MKQLDVFKKIGGILKELNDQYDYLKADTSELNELELELFVANAHFLKDHAEILRRLNERAAPTAPPVEKPEPVAVEIPKPIPQPVIQPAIPFTPPQPPPAPKPEPLHEQRFFEPVVQQHIPVSVKKLELTQEVEQTEHAPFNTPVIAADDPAEKAIDAPTPQINLSSESSGDSYSYVREEPETLNANLTLDEAQTWDNEEDLFEQEELTSQLDEKPVPVAETKTAEAKAETGDRQVLTFNQKMMAQRAEKASGHASPAELPVTDLKSAINLNDKLLYIKDLFNGYSLAYSEAIEIVNRFNTFEEAERFLKTNYVVKNNWDSKAATAEKFYSLLRRRYPVK